MLSVLQACTPVADQSVVRAEMSAVQPPLGTRLQNETVIAKSSNFSVFRQYKTDMSQEAIVRTYSQQLLANGWSVCSENKVLDWGRDLGARSVSFEKAHLEAMLFFPGPGHSYDYEFSLGSVSRAPWDSGACSEAK